MSPIVTNRPRLRENIHIRLGQQVPAKKKSGEDTTRPKALDTFRITSPHRALVDLAAQLYGGEVKPFVGGKSADRWEVVTERSELPCAIPPIDGFSQWLELWSGGGCTRRCNGVRELLGDVPCLCPDDLEERAALAQKGEACKSTTRLTVVLYELGELTGARIETHSNYAASELLFLESLYAAARERRTLVPAEVRIGERPAKDGKGMVKVPEVAVSTAVGLQTMGLAGASQRQLEAATEQAAIGAPDPSFGMPRQPIDVGGPPPADPSTGEVKRPTWEELAETAMVVIGDEAGAKVFFALITAGRGTNPKILNETESTAARAFLTQIERGTLEIDFKAEGGPCFMDPKGGEHLHVHHSSTAVRISANPPPPNWRKLWREAGVTEGALMRRAREAAAEMQLDVPSSTADLVDEDLVAVLMSWLAEQKALKAEKTGAPA
jgi:hypothetical protein